MDATGHALIGAYEGLTAWWLDHPAVTVDELGDWFLDLVWPGLLGLLHQARVDGAGVEAS